ncbi:ras-related protein Rab-44 [Aplochiton taeniatus]
MVGNSNVGKTSCIKRVQNGMFSPDLSASIGIDTCMHSITVDEKRVTLQFWDTAGQERYHSITKQVFHKAHAFLLMYDITSYQSFSDVRYWAACLKEGASADVIVLLLGNKNDCANRQVHSDEGAILAKEYNFIFMECSVATGENVIQSMETMARMLHHKVQNTQKGSVVLCTEKPTQKHFGCC